MSESEVASTKTRLVLTASYGLHDKGGISLGKMSVCAKSTTLDVFIEVNSLTS